MPDDNGASLKLGVQGGEEFRKNLKSAQQELKKLNAELKRDQAALGNHASQEKKNAVAAENLQKKIAQQRAIVQAMTQALNESKAKYGENANATKQWELKLINAEAALNKMQNELEGMSGGLDKATKSLGDAAQRTANFAEGIKGLGRAAGTVKDAVAGVFSTMLDNTKKTVDEMMKLISQAMAAGNKWTGISDIYGGNASTAQDIFRIASAAGVDDGTVNSLMQKLITKTHGGLDLSHALDGNYSQSNFESHLDYIYAVFNRLGEMAAGGTDITSITEQIFGRDFTRAKGFFADWNTAMNAWNETKAAGGSMSDDDISFLNISQHELTELQTVYATLKEITGLQLAKELHIDVMLNDTSGLLNNLISFMTADNEDARMEAMVNVMGSIDILSTDLNTAIAGLQEWVSNLAQPLTKSDSGIMQLLGNILTTISNALGWLNDPKNAETINKFADWFIKNKVIEMMTGKDIPGWAQTIINLVTDIATSVALIAGMRAIKNGQDGAGFLANLGKFLTSTGAKTLGGVGVILAGMQPGNTATDAQEWGMTEQQVAEAKKNGIPLGDYYASLHAKQQYGREPSSALGMDWLDVDEVPLEDFNPSDAYNQAFYAGQQYAQALQQWHDLLGTESPTSDIMQTLSDRIDGLYDNYNGQPGFSEGQTAITIDLTATMDGAVVAQQVEQRILTDIGYGR